MTIKVKEYESMENFLDAVEDQVSDETVYKVNKPNGAVCADLITNCKYAETAIRRFFKALANDNRFDGWEECITECIKNGVWKDTETCWNEETCRSEYDGGYFWEVEDNDGSFYICLNVVA
mgnify:FL=1